MQYLLEQIAEYEKSAIKTLNNLENIKCKLAEVYGLENPNGKENSFTENVLMIPFVAYETQKEQHLQEMREMQERHEREKKDLLDRQERREKQHQKIVIAISSVLLALVIGIVSIVFYIIENFDIYTSYQDITTGDNGTATIEDGIHYNAD